MVCSIAFFIIYQNNGYISLIVLSTYTHKSELFEIVGWRSGWGKWKLVHLLDLNPSAAVKQGLVVGNNHGLSQLFASLCQKCLDFLDFCLCLCLSGLQLSHSLEIPQAFLVLSQLFVAFRPSIVRLGVLIIIHQRFGSIIEGFDGFLYLEVSH